MPRKKFDTVDEYIGAQPKDAQPTLQRVRATLKKALPRAEEVISYQIPAFKQDGTAVIYFAGFKNHYSLYPAGTRLIKEFKDELEPYEYNNKGTVRSRWTARSRSA